MKLFMSCMLALLFASTCASGAAAADPQRPITVAHRGANRLADENTLKAFALAADYGVDYIECDPRLTADGVFIINHDKSLLRSTGQDLNVPDLTLEQVRAIKTKNGEPIPTLEQIFDLAKQKNVGVFIDTKEHSIPAMEKLLALAGDNGMLGRIVVQMWTHEQIKWLAKNYPDVTASLSFPAPLPSLSTVKKQGADWVGMLAEHADEKTLKQAGKLGLKVITMPLNSRDEMRAKLAAGLTVLQTDDVVLLKEFMDQEFGPPAAR